LESETISVVDVDTVRRERLLNLGTKPQQARAAKLFKSATASSRGQVVQQFAEVLETSGDIGRGRLVFEKRCATCHKLDGIGKSIGADLGSLKDRSGQAMLTAILDPNLAVEAKFLSFTAATLSGQTYAGMLLTETGTSITLIGADGKEHILPRAELELLSGSNRSFMPEGFEKDLTVQDLADVIRFIQSSTEPPKPMQ
jgi:putative heme-binding domain-containing protein